MSETFSPELEEFFTDMDAQHLALTYDDVRLETGPGNHHEPLPEPDISGHFSRNVALRAPFVSAAMDTVTEAPMAIALAQFGGIGVVHSAMDTTDQKREVRRVKLFMNGTVDRPITVRDDMSLEQVLNMCNEKGYDFRTFPVEDGNKRFVGLLTGSDFKFAETLDVTVGETMTAADRVKSVSRKISREKAYEMMRDEKVNMLPVLTRTGRVHKMYLHSDLKRILYESSGFNVDDEGRLRVAAAVPTDDEALERIDAMIDYLDVVVLDSANGDSWYAFETLKKIKADFPELDVVVGNVSDGRSAYELALAGADGIKVGQGPGSICTTRPETGIGKPQVSAIYDCAKAVEGLGVPICADGGITNHGDISIALAVGAGSVMMGNMLAGTKEAPGPVLTRQDGSRVKLYRGMGSSSAFRDSAASRKRYGVKAQGIRLAEGVESHVPYKGEVADVLELCRQGVVASMRYVKADNLAEHRAHARLRRITGSGLRESHPHDVMVSRS